MITKYLIINNEVVELQMTQAQFDAYPVKQAVNFLGNFSLEVVKFLKNKADFEESILVQKNKNVRQSLIDATDPIAIRHMRQELRFTSAEMVDLAKKGKALTTAQFKELEAYTQALRDLPTTLKTWPTVADSDWPKKPAFMDKPSTQGV